MSAVAAGPFRAPLLTGAVADETTSSPCDCRGVTNLTAYVTGTGTTSSGVITLEEAEFRPLADPPYGGTWSEIATINASDVSGGQQLAYHVGGPGGAFAYSFVRARVSTVIGGGGSVSVVLVGL